jgi:RNA polymerase sigma-70 factor (ECF subfamily)
MKRSDTGSIPTRASLLERLGNWYDHQSWEEFRNLYSGLIRRTARRAGLTEAEVQDIEQETLVRVAKNIRGFDPAGGNFKGWLLNQVRWRVATHFRDQAPQEKLRHHLSREGENDRTATEERVPDPGNLNQIWEEEWHKTLLERAVAQLCRRCNPKHAQILDLCVLQGKSAPEVARALEISVMTVYLVRTRLGRQLKREVDRLRRAGNL